MRFALSHLGNRKELVEMLQFANDVGPWAEVAAQRDTVEKGLNITTDGDVRYKLVLTEFDKGRE